METQRPVAPVEPVEPAKRPSTPLNLSGVAPVAGSAGRFRTSEAAAGGGEAAAAASAESAASAASAESTLILGAALEMAVDEVAEEAKIYYNELFRKPDVAQPQVAQAVIEKINTLYAFDNTDDFSGELRLSDDRKADVVKTFKEEKYFKDFCSDMIKENNEDESYFIFLDRVLKYCLDSENLSRILSKGNIIENFELLLTVMKSAKYNKYLFNTIYRLVPALENKFELPEYELDNNLKKAHIYWLLKFMNLI